MRDSCFHEKARKKRGGGSEPVRYPQPSVNLRRVSDEDCFGVDLGSALRGGEGALAFRRRGVLLSCRRAASG